MLMSVSSKQNKDFVPYKQKMKTKSTNKLKQKLIQRHRKQEIQNDLHKTKYSDNLWITFVSTKKVILDQIEHLSKKSQKISLLGSSQI